MKPSDYKITDLIPQRQPLVMIDSLEYADEMRAEGKLFITEANTFCHLGKFQEAGMVEFIAQSAAAWTGYMNLKSGKPVALGYIGAVKNLVIHSLPAAGSEIRSEVIIESELLGFTIISGKVIQNDKLLAECEMRIKKDS
jgi:predicted hotdog family 3-hydroxylacyl-ACP dehydratase